MKYEPVFALIIASVSLLVFAGCRDAARADGVMPNVAGTPTPSGNSTSSTAPSNDEVFDGKEIVKTDAEWKAQLTPAEYNILREGGTETAFRNEYDENHEKGTYYC